MSDTSTPTESEIAHARALVAARNTSEPNPAATHTLDSAALQGLAARGRELMAAQSERSRLAEAGRQLAAANELPGAEGLDDLTDQEVIDLMVAAANDVPRNARGEPLATVDEAAAQGYDPADDAPISSAKWEPPTGYRADHDGSGLNRR